MLSLPSGANTRVQHTDEIRQPKTHLNLTFSQATRLQTRTPGWRGRSTAQILLVPPADRGDRSTRRKKQRICPPIDGPTPSGLLPVSGRYGTAAASWSAAGPGVSEQADGVRELVWGR